MKRYWYAALGLMACGAAQAATTDVEMHLVTGQDRSGYRQGGHQRNAVRLAVHAEPESVAGRGTWLPRA